MVLLRYNKNHTLLLDPTASRKLAVDLAEKQSNKSCRKEVIT
jgi:hypothetical protein